VIYSPRKMEEPHIRGQRRKHKEAGRVCVPFDPDSCDDFDPINVPTLDSLMSEINANQDSNSFKSQRNGNDLRKTSLLSYVNFFEKHVYELEQSEGVAMSMEF
ncbi:hypothetical protein HDU96_000681, partial [Phlyctochytrium bullatum]